MKKAIILIGVTLAVCLTFGFNLPEFNKSRIPSKSSMEDFSFGNIPMNFVVNQGQWNLDVIYGVQVPNAAFWFTQKGVYYDLVQKNGLFENVENSGFLDTLKANNHLTLKVSLLDAHQSPKIEGNQKLPTRTNFFIGSDSSKWHANVPSYNSIVYKNVYPGIDMHYYGTGMSLTYEFIVEPNADYNNIKIEYSGVNGLDIADNGDLIIHTNWGDLVEKDLLVYQDINSRRCELEAEFVKISENAFSFNIIGDYDPEKTLVIDPTITFSTFFGGSKEDVSNDIVLVDSTLYIAGYTQSTDLPGTLGSYSENISGYCDAYVAKFFPDCSMIWYCTYLGGSARDEANALAVDRFGNAYVTGKTYSYDFPIYNAFQTSFQGNTDAFITKLSNDGDMLSFSTYLGGTASDVGYGIAIQNMQDTVYEVAITGLTRSTDFPVSSSCYQSTYGGNGDAFVTRLSSIGCSILASTYLGGSNTDIGYDIDIAGVPMQPGTQLPYFIVGSTLSSDFPTKMAEDDSYNGNGDAFVTYMNGYCTNIQMSTYYGGSNLDEGYGIVATTAGMKIYITGTTNSNDLHTCAYDEVYDESYNGRADAYIACYSGFTGSLLVSSYLGGSEDDIANDIALSDYGIYITGTTNSLNYPASPCKNDNTPNDLFNVFVSGINYAGTDLIFGQLVGGSQTDVGMGIAIDDDNTIYITGYTASPDYPTWNALFDSYRGGTKDAFVTKLFPFIPGDFNWDGDLNVSDAVSVINYVFNGAELAGFYEAGDANGDCVVNISDAVYLINFVFSGGNAPHYYCSNTGGSAKLTVVDVEITTNLEITDVRRKLNIDVKTASDLGALQLEFKITGDIHDIELDCKITGMNIIENQTNSRYLVCILDMKGMTNIPSGENTIIEIEYSGNGELVMLEAIATSAIGYTIPSKIYSGSASKVVPEGFTLGQNWPNPFNPETEISYSLNEACDVNLEIYNINGQKVACLVNSYQDAGLYTVTWDGSTVSGRKAASGVYLYRLIAGDYTETKKMTLMK